MLSKGTEAFLTARIDQGGMAIREFVRNNGVDEVLKVMERFVRMNQSDDPWEILVGTLAGYALAVALRDASAAEREGGGA